MWDRWIEKNGEDREVSNEIDDEDSEAMMDGKRGRVTMNESSDWSFGAQPGPGIPYSVLETVFLSI